MTCSPARLAANRLNAQKSTGPRTEEGKSRSRGNALKHGLCSTVVLAEDPALIEERIDDWFFPLKPQNEYHHWLVEKIAVYSLRIDRAERMERRLRDRKALKAELAWEDEVRLEIERLGGRIASSPAEVVEELQQSTVGCDWLISRWSMLARAADLAGGTWTPEQTSLAFDLLGTPATFRQGQEPGDLLDAHGRVIVKAPDGKAELARREVDGLIARREFIAPLDEVDRALTEADLLDETHPELKKVRRYEGTLHNRLRWCLAELRHISIHFKPNAELMLRQISRKQEPAEAEAAAAVVEPQPAPAPKVQTPPTSRRDEIRKTVAPHPPFNLEPHELPKDGSKPDFYKILLTRQEKREQTAERRRESKRRKLEGLRA